MSKRSVLSALIFCMTLAAGGAAEKKGEVQITREEGKLRISIDGQHFTDYVYEGYSRPFLFPLYGPGQVKMTRSWPMKEVPNEEHDHPHHKSFWWAHGDMNGVDFWSESQRAGKTVHEEFTEVKSGKVGVIKSRNKYVAPDGKVVATDERTLRIHPGTSPRVLDFEITLKPAEGQELKFGDTKEGTMALRLAETMRLKGKVGKGHIVTSEGVRDGQTWGKRAKWVDYYGPADGKEVGVAIFDHPSNPRHPTWWHVRDYGLFGANPFGIHDFEKKESGAGDLVVPKGETVTWKYRFYMHPGNEEEGKVEQAYQEYTKEVK